MANQLSETSVPHASLARPLPPLPPRRTQTLSISIPYRDDPETEEVEVEVLNSLQAQRSPPGYEPMYDYLRSQQQSNLRNELPNCQHNNAQTSIQVPYRDEPFIITITDTDGETVAPPPSYHDIFNPNEIELRNLLGCELDGTPAEETEEICKWLVAMLLIALTIVGVGTAFNWGRPTCSGRRC